MAKAVRSRGERRCERDENVGLELDLDLLLLLAAGLEAEAEEVDSIMTRIELDLNQKWLQLGRNGKERNGKEREGMGRKGSLTFDRKSSSAF